MPTPPALSPSYDFRRHYHRGERVTVRMARRASHIIGGWQWDDLPAVVRRVRSRTLVVLLDTGRIVTVRADRERIKKIELDHEKEQ